MSQYDTIVIGAGHNGLVCAAYLARAGQNVLVLEAAEAPGGLAQYREFHPGYTASIAHSISHFSSSVQADLGLADHGFALQAIDTVGLRNSGEHVAVRADGLSGGNDADAAAYASYASLMQRFAAALAPFWEKTMPRIGSSKAADLLTFAHMGLKLRGLGKDDMREFMRIASLPMRDLADEFFEDDLVKAVLCWDGLIGSKMAPRSPNGAVLALLYRLSGASGGGHAVPVGGMGKLADALLAATEAAGATVRLGAAVERIDVGHAETGPLAHGVTLTDGTTIEAGNVISSADPRRTFIDLLGVEHLDIGFTNRIRRLRCDGFVGKLHLALSDAPEFDGLGQPEGRMIIAPEMDAIEFAFDDAKYGGLPEHPVMEIVVPSVHDPALAPAGQHVLSAHVMYVPYALKGGWNDAARSTMLERSVETIAAYAPGIREEIVFAEFLSPADIEREYGVTGGHWHHAEFVMDQMLMMRPTFGAAQYATPVAGLYLCGASCHPAGDLVGAAGRNAAKEVLR
ncbi:MAG: NAD(P)/FAD-dependent oxidoreductase [Woeseiaceae bacterium]|nr:NAD(P)/FAD-dependent oxidoreductase [Woeseiaceae bacterium]